MQAVDQIVNFDRYDEIDAARGTLLYAIPICYPAKSSKVGLDTSKNLWSRLRFILLRLKSISDAHMSS